MVSQTLRTVLRLLLVLIALCWGVGQAGAQASPARSPQTGKYRSAQGVLKMRNTTNEQRRAAAARNAARKAAAGQKNQVGLNAYRGVRK